ncbi:MAG: TolB family protein, partial [Methanohalophilus sp.]
PMAFFCLVLIICSATPVFAGIEVANIYPLTDDFSSDYHYPAWSPDGTQITYMNDKAIWIMDADGSNPHVIYDGMKWDGDPCFSADGKEIYFASESRKPYSSTYINLFKMNADGSNITQLTDGADRRSPSISPDGSMLAYLSNIAGNYDIWVMDLTNKSHRQLTFTSEDEGKPSWSPDGDELIYSFKGNLWLTDVELDKSRQLTHGTSNDVDPFFLPSGEKIVFISDRRGETNIWLIDTEDDERQLLTDDRKVEYSPAAGPDGKKIVFGARANETFDLWMLEMENPEVSDGVSGINVEDTNVDAMEGEDISLTSENNQNMDEGSGGLLGNNLALFVGGLVLGIILFLVARLIFRKM